MPDYLYYKRDEEWVRVSADSYSRATSSAIGGKCPGQQYTIKWRVHKRRVGGRYGSKTFFDDRTINVSGGEYDGPKVRVPATSPGTVDIGFTHNYGWGATWYREGYLDSYNGDVFVDSFAVTSIVPRYPSSYQACAADTSGTCSTKFTLNGSTVLTLDSCPEVTDGRGCSDCCGELVAIAKKIQV